MDLVYLSETMAYNSIRNPIYERYTDTQWQPKYVTDKACKQQKSSSNYHRSGEHCKLCREKEKMKSLSNYIRSKSIECTVKSNSIPEECDDDHGQ
ncbi:uncharacterized protein [Rhodnius prolixus]|uniref:uncharacterized protein n=1 Tax=Rhodnius prolixus TaxID=13249 RepID=UPI003D1888C3